ncbi:hypothetical protein AKJ16_DCAP15477 [Drosera capensis]
MRGETSYGMSIYRNLARLADSDFYLLYSSSPRFPSFSFPVNNASKNQQKNRDGVEYAIIRLLLIAELAECVVSRITDDQILKPDVLSRGRRKETKGIEMENGVLMLIQNSCRLDETYCYCFCSLA